MNGAIFLVRPGEALVELRESPYDSENVLQRLLADYPALLAGDQMNPTDPRRWLFVSQEMGVPDSENTGDRWSLDHLFLDQDAVPTLIETKRSSDTRIRREVVGQMLDYAANAVVYWPIEKVRSAYERTCQSRGVDASVTLSDFLRESIPTDDYWRQVDTNLKAGRIRMVFVADEIPATLRRIVEFLNGQMDPAEVLAVEVQQFVGESIRTLVPRVVGATAEAEARKRPPVSGGTAWTDALFRESLRDAGHPELEHVLHAVQAWAESRGLRSYWGKGASGSYAPYLASSGRKLVCVYFGTDRACSVAFTHVQDVPGFQSEERRRELAEKLNQIAGVELPTDRLAGWRTFPTAALVPPESLTRFLAVLDWYFATVRTAIGETPI
ncbi:MAG: hypothetical protein ACRC7O_11240 [Fimbriiglobus sp.]